MAVWDDQNEIKSSNNWKNVSVETDEICESSETVRGHRSDINSEQLSVNHDHHFISE